jgi:RNA ligase
LIDIDNLLGYAATHLKEIRISRMDHLVKLNYSKYTQKHKIWNICTAVSRGIIIDTRSNNIIAYPFNKFFNKFEYDNKDIPIPLDLSYWVTTKYDGVLIIPFYHNDTLKFSTRGSFDNKYIAKAERIATFDSLPNKYSFMFELISPKYQKEGFLVTKYKTDSLVLIGIRDLQTKKLLLPPDVIDFAEKNDLNHYEIINESYEKVLERQKDYIQSTEEGWVLFFENTFLLKIKRAEYIDLFKTLIDVSMKKVLQQLLTGHYDIFISNLAEEIRPEIEKFYKKLVKHRNELIKKVVNTYKKIPQSIIDDRKSFFLYINKKYPKIEKYIGLYWQTKDESELYNVFYRDILRKKIIIPDLSL